HQRAEPGSLHGNRADVIGLDVIGTSRFAACEIQAALDLARGHQQLGQGGARQVDVGRHLEAVKVSLSERDAVDLVPRTVNLCIDCSGPKQDSVIQIDRAVDVGPRKRESPAQDTGFDAQISMYPDVAAENAFADRRVVQDERVVQLEADQVNVPTEYSADNPDA